VGDCRRWLGIALLCCASINCSFQRVPDSSGDDGGDDGGPLPDAAPCPALGAECIDDTLRECQTVGQLPVDTACAWGCLAQGGPAHCARLDPTGTVVTEADLAPSPSLLDTTKVLTAGTIGTINTDDGSISSNVRVAGTGIQNGIDYEVRMFDAGTAGMRSVAVFRFGKLALTGDWVVRGSHAIAIVSLGDVTIQGRLDLRGDCAGTNAGPGGFLGGASNADAPGPGGGKKGVQPVATNDSSGGGGGGGGDKGGDGGRANTSPATRPAGGTIFGDAAITLLVGGFGGGGGGSGGAGGGGGGALHLVTNGKVTLRSDAGVVPSGINAGGCGGDRGSNDAGGGGGAGGAVLIEAVSVELDGARLAVNGGGGGGGLGNGNPGNGADGALSLMPAAGGAGGIGGASGGDGGAAAGTMSSRAGETGKDADNAGGGGGAVGRIRINTRTTTGYTPKNGALVSPTLEETGTTSTKDLAKIQ